VNELPEQILLEVKTSRARKFVIDERDLDGIGPDGYLCVLIESRGLGGPRWILVPGRIATSGAATDIDLCELHEDSSLARNLQDGWSNWLLDRESMDALLGDHLDDMAGRIKWVRAHFPPHSNASAGTLRAVRLTRILDNIRNPAEPQSSLITAQLEGFLHQALLEDVTEAMGYQIVRNKIGVPDIRANLVASIE